MESCLRQEWASLQHLSVADLRDRYAQLFGEVPRTGNKIWLRKRIAWRLQALAEGELSERARRRAAELAHDADLRTTPPRPTAVAAPLATAQRPTRRARPRHPRLPPPGTILTRPYRGATLEVRVLEQGFVYQGQVYASLSAVAKAITGAHCSGFRFLIRSVRPGRSELRPHRNADDGGVARR
jgi:hypothetical protein